MFLSKNNIYEVWQSGKELVVPAGAIAYHLQSHREYSAGSKLKAVDRHGVVLVCRSQLSVQLREVPVTLYRGDAGPYVHVAWCSVEFAVSDIGAVAAQIDTDRSPLTLEEFEEKLQLSVKEALQGFEGHDLTSNAGQKAFESQAPKHISVIPGLKVVGCSLRRVLTEKDYFEEKAKWIEFGQRLKRLTTDETIWRKKERSRLDQAVAGIENETVLALLTDEEKKLNAIKRLSKYIELLVPGKPKRLSEAVRLCPYPNCLRDLSEGQTFVCERHKAEMHIWHSSISNPKWCDRCHEHIVWRRIKWTLSAAAIVLLVAGVIVCARLLTPHASSAKLEEEAAVRFDAKDYASAFHAYGRLSDRNPNNIALHRQIEECARRGRLERQFLDRYRNLVEQNPGSAILHNYLGNALLMLDPQDSDGKAHDQYQAALHLDGQFSPPLMNLGIIAFRKGRHAEAEDRFTQYLQLNPEDAVGWADLGALHAARVEADANDQQAVDKGLLALDKAIQLDPGLALAHKGRGRILEATGREAEALNAYRRSLALDYEQSEVRRQFELLAWDLGTDRVIVGGPDDLRTRSIQGVKALSIMQALDQGQFNEAERASRELILVDPENALAWRLLTKALGGQGRSDEAAEAGEKATKLACGR